MLISHLTPVKLPVFQLFYFFLKSLHYTNDSFIFEVKPF